MVFFASIKHINANILAGFGRVKGTRWSRLRLIPIASIVR